MRIQLALAAALSAGIASPAFAQDSGRASAREGEIVVTGRLAPDARAAQQIVRNLAKPVGGQLARFREPVCPMVSGLPEPYAAMVVDRIRSVAREAGARVAPEKCASNLILVIVDRGPAFASAFHREHPGEFRGIGPRELRRLTEQEGAARSWSTTSARNEFGMKGARAAASRGFGTAEVGYQGSSITLGGGIATQRVYGSSIVNPNTQQAIEATYVVLETQATMGKRLTQLADYTAMRGLAMTVPGALDGSEDTILRLFDDRTGASAPRGLTAMDLAYLKGLYEGAGARTGAAQIRRIARRITADGDRR